jgi:uncharacterized protein (DUF736 family)
MSQYFDNTNRGVLFKELNKRNDRGPDFKGTLNVNGDDFEIVAWVKTSKKGTEFLSLSVKPARNPNEPVQAQTTRSYSKPLPVASPPGTDDDIPF